MKFLPEVVVSVDNVQVEFHFYLMIRT